MSIQEYNCMKHSPLKSAQLNKIEVIFGTKYNKLQHPQTWCLRVLKNIVRFKF